MTRRYFIERTLIQIYGGLPEDDHELTYDIINAWLPDAIALAAKRNYSENIQLEGIGYTNNSFYSTFSGIAITADQTDNSCYSFVLPEIPLGIGRTDGLAEIRFKGPDGQTSYPAIPVSIAQWGYMDRMPFVSNHIFILPEGKTVRAKTSLPLWDYTATAKMISGGDATDLDSELNVPADYYPVMVEYLKQQLMLQKAQRQDITNDGNDIP